MFSPFGNETAAPPVNWQSEPNARGTWNILSSCLITLGLSLWTALHLNIPAQKEEASQRWRKVGWLILGLLAPEMVAFTAWNQRRAAERLTSEMQRIFGQEPEPAWLDSLKISQWRDSSKEKTQQADVEMQEVPSSRGRRRHKWTSVHSFYAIMGGFAFDTSSAKPNFLPNGRSRLTPHLRGLIYIAEHAPSILPDLSVEQIRDKSKADGLAKFLVCAQALWFCVQCIVRLCQEQAISLLELNVFGHALCALLIYGLWWHKPLDVGVPNLLEGEEAWELCALMCVNSDRDQRMSQLFYSLGKQSEWNYGEKYGERGHSSWSRFLEWRRMINLHIHCTEPRMVLRWQGFREEGLSAMEITQMPSLENGGGRDDEALRDGMVAEQTSEVVVATDAPPLETRSSSPSDCTLPPQRITEGQRLLGFRCAEVIAQGEWVYGIMDFTKSEKKAARAKCHKCRQWDNDRTQRESPIYFELDAADLRRWSLVSRAMRRYRPDIDEPRAGRLSSPGIIWSLYERMYNWPSPYQLRVLDPIGRGKGNVILIVSFTVAGFLYGGLHLIAWNAHFASKAQQVLWRFSGLSIVSSGFFVVSFIILQRCASCLRQHFKILRILSRSSALFIFGCVLLVIFLGCYVAGYVLARIYLVVECFLQIARLPLTAYDVPQWSQYFPHIG